MKVQSLNLNEEYLEKVFFEGSTALVQGQAVCYNRDYGTASALDDSRDRRVENPNSTNHLWFAGVVSQAYPANAAGQWITIYKPGSTCLVLADAATTINGYGGFIANDAGSLATQANVGKFSVTYNNGFGIGTVQFMQTIAAAGLCQARVIGQGQQVGGVEVFTGPGTATVVSPFGTSVLTNSADNTATPWTLANGSVAGQRKTIVFASITTANKIDFGATKVQSIAGGALSRYTSNTTAGTYVFEWSGAYWTVKQGVVSTLTIS